MKFRGKRLLAVNPLSGVLYLIAMVLGIMFTQTGKQMKVNAARNRLGRTVGSVGWLPAHLQCGVQVKRISI